MAETKAVISVEMDAADVTLACEALMALAEKECLSELATERVHEIYDRILHAAMGIESGGK